MSRYFESLINRSSVQLSGKTLKANGFPVSEKQSQQTVPQDIGEHAFIDSNSDQSGNHGESESVMHINASQENRTAKDFDNKDKNVKEHVPSEIKKVHKGTSFLETAGIPGLTHDPVEQSKTNLSNNPERVLHKQSFSKKDHIVPSKTLYSKQVWAEGSQQIEQHKVVEKQSTPDRSLEVRQSIKNQPNKRQTIKKQAGIAKRKTGEIEEILKKTEAKEPIAGSEKEMLSNYIINQVQTWVQEDVTPMESKSQKNPIQENIQQVEVSIPTSTKPVQDAQQAGHREAVRLIETDNQLSIGHIDITIEAPVSEKTQHQPQPVVQAPSKQESQSFLNWQRHYQTI